jgi:hypothetical protein
MKQVQSSAQKLTLNKVTIANLSNARTNDLKPKNYWGDDGIPNTDGGGSTTPRCDVTGHTKLLNH